MVRFISLVSLAFLQVSAAWIVPKDVVNKAASFGAAATVAVSIFSAPLIANAADFTGSYSDPKHPNCLREIVMDGKEAKISGTDGTPGCPVDGSGKQWALSGKVAGDEILVDFSPKGGPKDLKGIWDGSGIKWPDGNKWSTKS
eukprot:CAMPEP_0202457764 /NCGR_PEP_ID=MMETSP1360-20130828/14692_1 /ASSEMBLY_ACC=CAM_ASM_000848 /TAXON_ID=515479 /ORGANISM="Licmophora paradoxa, Strain CCMP2313" /LENGTH=142 /DNA_ID=CAMNT_0049077925 /DNA_START=7 /DNA_END=435 /DNA_ORIENTATION=-